MKYIDEVDIRGKVALVRVDFNVPLSPALTVEDDQRIKACIPTIKYLLDHQCKVVLVTHLGRPVGIVNKLSVKPVAVKLSELIGQDVKFIEDMAKVSKVQIEASDQSIFMLENIRFYKEEQENDTEFVKKLSWLADIFVNDAFSASHRTDASVVGVAEILPSYGGLLLKTELINLKKLVDKPGKPFVAILGGSKISTKLGVIEKLLNHIDVLIIGGGIANTFLFAAGNEIGNSICEKEMKDKANVLVEMCRNRGIKLLIPIDVVVGGKDSMENQIQTKAVEDLTADDSIFDIGERTKEKYRSAISDAKTIMWNGPVGYFENPTYAKGSDSVFESIISNSMAFSVAGGGDTLSYLAGKDMLEKISFISTGGGAMLEYLANGSLPGIDALSTRN